MIDSSVNLKVRKPLDRCYECDEETNSYNVFISPTNERKVICSKCLMIEEKGVPTKHGFNRVISNPK